MKESARHLVFIDYLRGIAILSVFLYHCLMGAYGANSLRWDWMTRDFHASWSFIALLPLHYGFIGVPIFFVVSGFCIHLSFEQQGREWKSFFIRRFFRIYPAYLVAVFMFSCCYTNGAHDFCLQFGFHALLIHNFQPQTFYSLGIAFWTIAIEAQLYLLYPVLLLLVRKWGWKPTLICLAACEILLPEWNNLAGQFSTWHGLGSPNLLMKATSFVDHYLIPSPLGYWFSWSLGALAADAYLKGRQMPLAKSSTSFWVFLVVVSYFFSPLWSHFFTLSALLTTKIIGNYLSTRRPQTIAPNIWLNQLRFVGVWSYSIYLLHGPLLLSFLPWVRQRYCPNLNPLFSFLCFVSFCLIIFPLACIWYQVFERPGIGMGKSIIQRMTGKTSAIPLKPSDT